MKDGRIIVPTVLQYKELKQVHLIHMGIEKTRLFAFESISWVNMNVNINEMIKNCPTCLDFHVT